MEPSKVIRLSHVVETFDRLAATLRAEGLPETALLAEMARLDLQTRLHDISEHEFKGLCEAIENGDLVKRPSAGATGKAALLASRGGLVNARARLRSAARGKAASKDNRHA
jgi:hypothetical protein